MHINNMAMKKTSKNDSITRFCEDVFFVGKAEYIVKDLVNMSIM